MAELGEHADKLEELSEQEVIEIVTTHLLEQGERSYISREGHSDRCLYKGPNGICCAAAPFVKYEDWMDAEDTGDIDEGGGTWDAVKHTPKHERVISTLQKFHDHSEPDQWLINIMREFPDVNYNFLKGIDIHPNCRVSPAYLNRVLS